MRAQIATIAVFAVTATALPCGLSAAPAPVALDRFRPCLAIEDMTKERLDCFDAIMAPEPRQTAGKPANIGECRFQREEDERLRCFNGFLVARTSTPPRPTPTTPQIAPDRWRPCHNMDGLTKERLDCFDAVTPPAPRAAFTAAPRSIVECRFYGEQDDRLRCYLNFTAKLFAKLQRAASPPPPKPKVDPPSTSTKHVRVGRGGCGSRGGAGYRTRSGKCASRKR